MDSSTQMFMRCKFPYASTCKIGLFLVLSKPESVTLKCDFLDYLAASSWSWSSDLFLSKGNREEANVLCGGSSFHRLFK